MLEICKKIISIVNRYRDCNENDIDFEYAKNILEKDEEAVLIDVRSHQEYKERHLKGSKNIPLYDLNKQIEEKVREKNTCIICYCQTGNRSRKAIEILKRKGYNNVYNIKGGLDNIQ